MIVCQVWLACCRRAFFTSRSNRIVYPYEPTPIPERKWRPLGTASSRFHTEMRKVKRRGVKLP